MHAQIPTSAGPAQWLVDEHANWRVHLGDDPAWASPAFDDSQWQPFDLNDQLKLDTPSYHGNARWFRTRLHLPPTGPVDLLLGGNDGAFEVYLDGRLISGPIRPSVLRSYRRPLEFPIRSASGPTDVTLAIRSHSYRQQYFSRPELFAAVIGSPSAIRNQATVVTATQLGSGAVDMGVFSATFLIGLAIIGLFAAQRNHPEYLWLGLTFIVNAFETGLLAGVGAGVLLPAFNAFLGDPSTYLVIVAQIEFVYAFTGKRPGRTIRIYEAILVLVALLIEPIVWNAVLPLGWFDIIENGLTLPGMILIVATLILFFRRGNREAGWLILPMFLLNLSSFIFDSVDMYQLFHPTATVRQSVSAGLVQFDLWSISQVIFLAVIGFVLFRRFTQVSRDQALAQAELESARTVQQILVPEAIPTIPGLHIESVYLPAQQVGGDFFQIIPIASGGVLAVLGDVSGKGLPAAMNVALIVGTLRTLAENTNSPAAILAGLNRRLHGRSQGFTTCLAIRILPNGQATLASAGHLNPYLSGREFDVEHGLPLGLSLDADYPETTLTLSPTQTLTLITDGVLEATDPTTRELFGFDRTAAISHQPAQHIAQTAQTFGQEDDIAVLTLCYTPV